MNKSELRAVFLEKRRELSAHEITDKSRQIADHFFAGFSVKQLKVIHCFVSIPKFGEIDTSLIYERLWAESPGIRTVAPRMNKATGEIESLDFGPGTQLIESRWGIREPAGDTVLDPSEIDAVLVPLLCYDQRGNRVGYGKGFYDRFLAKCPSNCLKIGLSFFAPVTNIDDVNESDVPIDRCITPERTYRFELTDPL